MANIARYIDFMYVTYFRIDFLKYPQSKRRLQRFDNFAERAVRLTKNKLYERPKKIERTIYQYYNRKITF